MHHFLMRCGGNVRDLLLGYFHRKTRDCSLKPAYHYLGWTFRLSRASLILAAGVAKLCLRLVAAGSDAFTKPKSAQNTVEFGVLNYRTGKIDNGLDPFGWYDPD